VNRGLKRWTGCLRTPFVAALLILGPGGFTVMPEVGTAQVNPSVSVDREVEVRRLSDPLVEADPGEIVTLAFRVENRSDRPQLFQELLELPPGWNAVFPLSEFSLGVGESTNRLVGVQPGSQSAAGAQRVRYGVISLPDPTIRGEADAEVRLRDVYALQLFALGETLTQVFAGETAELGVRVLNQGNTALQIDFSTRLDLPAQVSVSPSNLRVAPGESAIVRLRISTNVRMTEARSGSLSLTASTPHESDGRPVGARLSLRIEAIPLRAGTSAWLRYPLTFSTFVVGDSDSAITQFTLQGDGYLDEARRRRLQIFARGPDRQGRSLFNQRDEYWGVVELPWAYVTGGDRAFTLSELSAQSRYGRGGGLELNPFSSPLVLSGFYVEDRFQIRDRTDWGGSLSLGSGRGPGNFRSRAPQELRVNALEMDWAALGEDPAYRERIGTVEGQITLGPALRLGAEAALSESTEGEGQTGEAWRVAATGRLGSSWDYRLRGRRAGPQFSGRLFDSADYDAHVGLPLGFGVRGTLGAQRYQRNLDANPARGPANREHLYRGGLNVPLPRRARISLNYQFYDRDDARLDVARGIEQHRGAVGVSQVLGSLSYRAEVRASETTDRVEETQASGLTYGLTLNYRPSARFSLSGRGSVGRDDVPRDSRLGREGQDYSGAISWAPWERLRLHGQYSQRQQRFPDEPLREREEQEYYSAGFDLRVTQNQDLRADVRRSETRFGMAQTLFSATYQVRLGVPFMRRGSMGSLSGQAMMRTSEGEVPLENAVVRVAGTATRTDAEGRFRFRTLPEGEHTIRVDEVALGAHSVPAPGQPATVQVLGRGRKSDVRLAFVQGATVRGRLEIAPAQPTPDGVLPSGRSASEGGNGNGGGNGGGNAGLNAGPEAEAAPLPVSSPLALGGILVELANGSDVRRTLTDPDGNFLFQLLPSGSWTLKVYEQGLPALHELQRETTTLQLEPGDETRVTLLVLPIERRMRFRDGGGIETGLSGLAGSAGAQGVRPNDRRDDGGERQHD